MILVYSIYTVFNQQNVLVIASYVIRVILVTLHEGAFLEYLVCSTSLRASLWSARDLLEYYVNVTQNVRDISPLMHKHQNPLLVPAVIMIESPWTLLGSVDNFLVQTGKKYLLFQKVNVVFLVFPATTIHDITWQ